jgi:hypothetical protein
MPPVRLNMPVLTGLGLAADVASIRPDLPVIHLGHISESVRSEAARMGYGVWRTSVGRSMSSVRWCIGLLRLFRGNGSGKLDDE